MNSASLQINDSSPSPSWTSLPGACLLSIAGNLLGVRDLLAFCAVCTEWRQAVNTDSAWETALAAAYGCHEAHIPGRARERVKQLACSQVKELDGLCEDLFSVPGGLPYRMHIRNILAKQPRPSAVRQRDFECEAHWDCTNPASATRVKFVMCGVSQEVAATTSALHPTCHCPLYSQRGSLVEYARLPGGASVDIPNKYFAFKVGPVLLGTFLPPEASLATMRLSSYKQMLGTFFLHPWANDTPAGNTPSICAACPCAGNELCMLRRGPEAAGPSPLSGMAATTSVGDHAMGLGAEKHLNPNLTSNPVLPGSAAAARGSGSRGREGCTCDWLRWHGLQVGACSTGTVVANFQLAAQGCPAQGVAMLGTAQVSVQCVSAAPTAQVATQPAKLRLQLLIHLPAREWVISSQGVPLAADLTQEPGYTAALTTRALVDVDVHGTLVPVDGAAGGSGTGENAGRAGLMDLNAMHESLSATPPASMGDVHVRALVAEECLNSPGVHLPGQVDVWASAVHGRVSGGILTGMLVHPIVGRAVFCVGGGGLEAMCF